MKTTAEKPSALSPAQKTDLIARLTAHVLAECSAVDMEQRFRDSLNECNPEVSVGSLSWTPSRVLEIMDPVAFRCGVADSSDHENVYEIDGDYYDSDKVEEAREEFVAGLQSDLDDAQKELDHNDVEAGEEDCLSAEERAELEGTVKSCEESISLVENHSF